MLDTSKVSWKPHPWSAKGNIYVLKFYRIQLTCFLVLYQVPKLLLDPQVSVLSFHNSKDPNVGKDYSIPVRQGIKL